MNFCSAGSFPNTKPMKPLFVPNKEEPELIYEIDLTIRDFEYD